MLGMDHIELDALHWGPNWEEPSLDIFREKVGQALAGNNWITDGNYGKARDIIWNRADTLIWLDYPLPIILWRLVWRTLRRVITRETLWHGNTESLYDQFFTHESLIYYALSTHQRRRNTFLELLRNEQYPHLSVITHHHPRQTEAWLKELSSAQQSESEQHDS